MEVTSAMSPLSQGNLQDLQVVMPAFATGTHAHRHTVHSALVSLAALGIGPNRIVVRRAGREASPSGTVVRQNPAAGALLARDTMVELDVAGLGFTHALPVGMWDSGGEAAAGTREILEPFDDPLEKLKHWFHEGAPLFRIAPDDPQACARWLALFGVDAAEWPRTLWYRLASLIAGVSQLSCSESGCALVLNVLFGLPVKTFSYEPRFALLPDEALSKLGARSSRLGVDLLLGDTAEDLAILHIEIGPVSLETYERFQGDQDYAVLLRRTFDMIMPFSTEYEVSWSVLDHARAPRLGSADQNGRLGINSHMGGSGAIVLAEAITDPPVEPETNWSKA